MKSNPGRHLVTTAFWLLLLLVLSSLATPFIDGPIVQGLVAVGSALALASAAIAIRPLEGDHLVKSIRPLIPLMAIPAAWIVVQVMPMPISALTHPIWASAREALNETVTARMTIDVGDTVIALGRYLAAAAIVLAAAALTIDRQRAEWTLWALVGVTGFAALVLTSDWLSRVAIPNADGLLFRHAPLQALACIGVSLSAAAVDRSIERFEMRRLANQSPTRNLLRTSSVSLLALLLCGIAVLCALPAPLQFAAACGAATVVYVVIVRRLGLGRWAAAGLAIIALLGTGIFVASQIEASRDWSLRFSPSSSEQRIPTVERMIIDNRVGSGAGTFAALIPLYAGRNDASTLAAPTFATQLSVEMGRPAPFVAAALALVIVGQLLRGAFERGRDSFYAAGAASCVVTVLIEAFLDSSLTATPVMVVGSATIGLGFAQRMSRSLQLGA